MLLSADGCRGNGVALLSSPDWGVRARQSSGSPLRRANNHPSCVPSFCRVSARWHSTPVFYLRHEAGFQNSQFYVLLLILWGRVATLWSVPVCPRNAVAQLHSGSEFMVKCSNKQHQGLLPSASVCIPMLVNRDAHWCCQFFCPRERPSTIPKCTPKRGTIFPYVTQRILRQHCPLPGLCTPSPPEHR